MARDIRSAHTKHPDQSAAASELIAQLAGEAPLAIVFFASHKRDGRLLSERLRQAFPGAQVIGCTTAGELTQHVSTFDSVSLLALGAGKVRRAAASLARFDAGVASGIAHAGARMAEALSLDLRTADPKCYVGLSLIEGLHMKEEAANEALGNVAPLLSFVGASAGDRGEFVRTRVFCNGEESEDGAALLLLEANVPFVIGKTCSFEPKSRALSVTRADVAARTVYELDHRPVLEVYAAIVGRTPSELDAAVFMENPFGLMIDGEPWIRSPQQVLADGGLKFYCQLLEGAEIHIMQSTDLVAGTHRELQRVRDALGGTLSGGFAFNCILRRLELDAKQQHGRFLEAFSGLEMAGFHTYGESWLGHMNQTLTGLWFQ